MSVFTFSVVTIFWALPICSTVVVNAPWTEKANQWLHLWHQLVNTNDYHVFLTLAPRSISDVKWKKVLPRIIFIPYFDDIFLFTHGVGQFLKYLAAVLIELKKAKLKIKPSKAIFLQREVSFPGHLVSGTSICPELPKVEDIRNFSAPKTYKYVHSFLDLVSWFCCFVLKMAEISSLLYQFSLKHNK